jgi:C4-dicarboxylate-specific signal transduction histidine kinase
MDSFAAVGTQTAALAARVLRGESPASIGARESDSQATLVDWRALRRWGLDEALLPPGTEVRFREPSLWETRRTDVLLVAGFIAFQFAMIVALLIERKRRMTTQRSLRASEEQIAVAAAAAHLGVWTWSAASREVWVTSHCQELLGLSSGQRTSTQSMLEAIDLDDRATLRQALRRVSAAGASKVATSFEVEVRRARAEGIAPRWLRVNGRMSGTRDAMTGVVMDITAGKQAQIEAEDRQQQLVHFMRVAELGGLSGALAHELNQPLTAILGNAEAARRLLARQNVDLATMREIIDDIVEENTRAGLVIGRMRALIKRGKPHREAIDVNRLVGDVVALMRGALVDRQVTAKIRSNGGLPDIAGDPVQLQQVLINLILNACEAMSLADRDERHVLLSTSLSDGGFVAIAVSDRGPGISQEVQHELFKPFVTTKSRNLGLGLSICRWILDEHGGRLSANNNRAEPGATFTVELPVRAGARHGN